MACMEEFTQAMAQMTIIRLVQALVKQVVKAGYL